MVVNWNYRNRPT